MGSPELKRTEPKPLTPRSLRAFPVQLNHGEARMERKIMVKPRRGAAAPKKPAILRILTFKTRASEIPCW